MGSSSTTLAARAARIAMSPTMKVAAEAHARSRRRASTSSISAPASRTFRRRSTSAAAAHAAIDANFTKYTTNSGTDELKKAIVARYKTDYGVEYATNEVIVTAGGKQALFNAVDGALRRRRRGHHAHAGLADARRADQARRRDAGHRAHARRGRLHAARRDVPHGDHAEDARHHHQLAGQPDRRADFGGGSRRPSPTEAAKRGIWILLDLCYEKLIYDPTPHNLPGVLARTMTRSRGPLRLGVEGVRDDRLALRLDARARGRRGAPATRCRATRRRTCARLRKRP